MKVGIIGAGQLARMLILSATPLGITFTCIGKKGDCAEGISDLVDIDLQDTTALLAWASACDVVTFENENIDCALLKNLHTETNFYPPINSIMLAQDRLVEKNMLSNTGVKTAPYKDIASLEDLQKAVGELGIPAILKTRRFGYDGKGQFTIKQESDIQKAWNDMGDNAYGIIYESFINFDLEVSQICSRNSDGKMVFYPLAHNIHDKGVLVESIAPYENDILTEKAQKIAKRLCKELNYVGTLAIEFFVTGDDLIVNEVAPRVHNSGHWTIEGANTSQFENHIRAICNLPLGSTQSIKTTMLNCLGSMPSITETLAIKNVKRHDYNKPERSGRKVGHLTLTHAADNATQDLRILRALLDKSK